MKDEYSLEKFVLALGFDLTPWQSDFLNRLEKLPSADKSFVLEFPRRSRKSYNYEQIKAAMARQYTPQEAYEEDVRRCPLYGNGSPRPSWASLTPNVRRTWQRNPTPRNFKNTP